MKDKIITVFVLTVLVGFAFLYREWDAENQKRKPRLYMAKVLDDELVVCKKFNEEDRVLVDCKVNDEEVYFEKIYIKHKTDVFKTKENE